jgi:hypothetical protein
MLQDSLTDHDRARLEAYSRNLVDHHLITDLLPRIAEFYFFSPEDKRVALSALQQALLVGLGLQLKTVDALSLELNLPVSQLLAMLNKAIRKFSKSEDGHKNVDTAGEGDLETALKGLPSTIKSGTVVSVPTGDAPKEPGTEPDQKPAKKKPAKFQRPEPKEFHRSSAKKHKRG